MRNVPIPGLKGEIKRARVGGGCIAMSRGGEVKSDSLSRESKPRVTWNGAFFFFELVTKMARRLLSARLTAKSVPAGTKLVLFGRYVINIYVGISPVAAKN